MLSNLHRFLPASDLSSFFALSPKRTIAYAMAAFLAFSFVWYILWRLPIVAFFRKPVEVSGKCPLCGSRDVRPSRLYSVIDHFRKKLGLLPFRCRGCTQRFFSRSSRDAESAIPSQVEAGL
jgi:hypothetical protein